LQSSGGTRERFSRGRHKWQQQRHSICGHAGCGSAVPSRRSGAGAFFTGTPEIYFGKAIDNSRLVKVEDPGRNREMKQFGSALACLFLLVFTYAWQHFRAIEYGYQIESAKRELSNLTETNRALKLEDASLRDPERIDVIARRMGLVPPEPGQVIRHG
jgi:cell division protein FtsL